jgi:RNA polymerase sigma-70 factor, ECF subfamily
MGEPRLVESDPARAAATLSREVLEACRAGDPRAFRSFVLAYERPVFALISRIAGVGPHVQDVAQETFLRAYRGFSSFDLDGPARPLTWLLTIAVRLAMNAKRSGARRPKAASLVDANDVPDVSTPETHSARRELGRAIAEAAEALSIDQRAVFVLSEFHGMSIGEIAAALAIPEGTVKTRLFRAREQLRERLHAFAKETSR